MDGEPQLRSGAASHEVGALNLEPVTTRRAAFSDAVSVYNTLMAPDNADIGVVLEYGAGDHGATLPAKASSPVSVALKVRVDP